jgi:hypothetical protein
MIDMKINCEFVPDLVHYTCYKYGLCSLCKIEKEKDKQFDSKDCPHCKKETKIMSGYFTTKK